MQRIGVVSGVLCALTLIACSGGGSPSTRTVPASTVVPALPSPTPAVPGAIQIAQPAPGSTVALPFEVAGTANVFEGALVVQVRRDDGALLCERSVQATSGTGTPGTWRTTMAFAPDPGGRRATIRAFDRSPRDGSEENVATRDVALAGDAPAIVITSPRCNADVLAGSTLDVSGTASVFEAQFTLELRDASGRAVRTEHITATAAAPDTGQWRATIDLAGLSAGVYEVAAYDLSARDGSVEHLFAVPIRITV